MLYGEVYAGEIDTCGDEEFRCRGKKSTNKSDVQQLDLAIKVYLDEGELKKLHDFEEDCMDDLARRHKLSHISPTAYQNMNKNDPILIKQLTEENATLRIEIEKVEHKMSSMEQSQIQILQLLQNLNQNQQQIPPKPITIPSSQTTNMAQS
uniref:Uncharacterized protein n=1 Tax=Panagrolaimus sp. ES5 TaxID=591445 RepID=A0AC34GXV2_9BILA